MTDEILPLGYRPKTRRVCQPYIDQIAALSARLADAEAALATARADALIEAVSCVPDHWTAGHIARNRIITLIRTTPPAKGE